MLPPPIKNNPHHTSTHRPTHTHQSQPRSPQNHTKARVPEISNAARDTITTHRPANDFSPARKARRPRKKGPTSLQPRVHKRASELMSRVRGRLACAPRKSPIFRRPVPPRRWREGGPRPRRADLSARRSVGPLYARRLTFTGARARHSAPDARFNDLTI